MARLASARLRVGKRTREMKEKNTSRSSVRVRDESEHAIEMARQGLQLLHTEAEISDFGRQARILVHEVGRVLCEEGIRVIVGVLQLKTEK